jgi:hypothetical protein
MRFLIGAGGTLALVIASFAVRSSKVESVPAMRRADPSVVTETLKSSDLISGTSTLVSDTGDRSFRLPKGLEAQVPGSVRNTGSVESEEQRLDREAMLQQFEIGLDLTGPQRASVGKILWERDAEIAAYHSEIRASGVFWVWGHEKKSREILAVSQARVTSILSPEQAQRLSRLYEDGRLSEGVSFEITPEMVVLR